MNWLRSLARRAVKWTIGHPSGGRVTEIFGGNIATNAGVAVDETTAMNFSAVWQAVRVYAETVGSLPLILYRRGELGKSRAEAHPLYTLLHDEPNPEMTPLVFKETLQSHVCLWGNAYAEIERSGDGRPVALWPLPPSCVRPMRDAAKRIVYEVSEGVAIERLPAADVLHVPGLSWDGLCGYSPIQVARQSIGLALGTEKFGARLFGTGATPGGVLEHPNQLSDTARKNLRESWERTYGGVDNSHKVAILEEGLTWKQTSIPPEDAQFLETRKFQILEVARWFNLPPHMLRELERATFSNIEHQGIEFVTYSLRPWLVRWEQEISRKLLMPDEKRAYFAEFLLDALLRGDTVTRYQAYSTGRNNGWLNVDEIRGFENLNPLPGPAGEDYLRPSTMLSVERQPRGHALQMIEVTNAVVTGLLPKKSAYGVLHAGFPALTDEDIAAIVDPLEVNPDVQPNRDAKPVRGAGDSAVGPDGQA